MSTRNVAQGIGHGNNGQAEGEGDAGKADPECGKGGGQNGGAAATEHQPEGAEAFRGESTTQCHGWPSSSRAAPTCLDGVELFLQLRSAQRRRNRTKVP